MDSIVKWTKKKYSHDDRAAVTDNTAHRSRPVTDQYQCVTCQFRCTERHKTLVKRAWPSIVLRSDVGVWQSRSRSWPIAITKETGLGSKLTLRAKRMQPGFTINVESVSTPFSRSDKRSPLRVYSVNSFTSTDKVLPKQIIPSSKTPWQVNNSWTGQDIPDTLCK